MYASRLPHLPPLPPLLVLAPQPLDTYDAKILVSTTATTAGAAKDVTSTTESNKLLAIAVTHPMFSFRAPVSYTPALGRANGRAPPALASARSFLSASSRAATTADEDTLVCEEVDLPLQAKVRALLAHATWPCVPAASAVMRAAFSP